MRRRLRCPRACSLMFAALVPASPAALAGQEAAVTVAATQDAGRGHYLANCARCHGVDGGGGEGPPLARSTLSRAPDDAALDSIIAAGIEGSAMGPTWWLGADERRAVVGFVRSLAPSGPDQVDHLPGDVERGRVVFEEEGCARCHTIRGFGTARGPDLSTVGGRRGPAYLREAVVDPAAALPRGGTAMPRDFVDYLVVRVVDRTGRSVRGMRMNEDSYTLQLKDTRGVIHSFYKPDLMEIEREFDRSLMQSYADRLTPEQLDDLVAYMASLTGRPVGVS